MSFLVSLVLNTDTAITDAQHTTQIENGKPVLKRTFKSAKIMQTNFGVQLYKCVLSNF